MPNLCAIGRWLRKNSFYRRHFTVGYSRTMAKAFMCFYRLSMISPVTPVPRNCPIFSKHWG